MNVKKATQLEDNKIMELVKEHGLSSWELIGAKLGTIISI